MIPDEPRSIIVRWRDVHGKSHSERRRVYFAKGFGPYIRWNRKPVPVDAMQTEVTMPGVGPSQTTKLAI